MKNQEQAVQEAMRRLIAKSCSFKRMPSSEYKSFHKSLLKFFFNTIDVNIDYEAHEISLWNSKPLTLDPIKLYNLNEAISSKVNYTNLEETLKGCLELVDMQTRFYKTLLFTYNHVSEEVGDVMSA
jgi:hypothetical protein